MSTEQKEITVEQRSQNEMVEAYNKIQQTAGSLVDQIIKLFAPAGYVGRISYMQNLSIEKLEECMHRVNDGMHFLMQQSPESREAAALKVDATKGPGLQVVQGGK